VWARWPGSRGWGGVGRGGGVAGPGGRARWAAGAVVAAPTIKTTNDMPIVEPPSFNSLGLISFQINAHYLDPDPNSTHMGETREVRINQFLEDNETPVVGLREGCMVRVAQGVHLLKGRTNARIFRRGSNPVEREPGSTLDDLID